MSSKRKERDKGKVNAFVAVEALSDLNKQFAKALTQASRTYLRGIVAMQEELLGIASGQIKNLEKASENLPSATYANEVIRIQETWARKVSEQYMYEAERLVQFASQTSSNSWSPILHAAPQKNESDKPVVIENG